MPRRRTVPWRRWAARAGGLAVWVALAALAAGVVMVVRDDGEVYVRDDTEALARVIRSEVGTSSMQKRVHVAWATRNLAAARKQSIAAMACDPCGPQEAGRPVSSRQAPTDEDRELAKHVLEAPPLMDPTGGATNFVNPALQDELAAKGTPGYRGRPYRHVQRTWREVYKWEPYYRLGPDLELWGPRRRR